MARVRFFSHMAQVLGLREQEVRADTLDELLDKLRAEHGETLTQRLPHCKLLLNDRAIDPRRDGGTALGPDDEVGLLPPAAGG